MPKPFAPVSPFEAKPSPGLPDKGTDDGDSSPLSVSGKGIVSERLSPVGLARIGEADSAALLARFRAQTALWNVEMVLWTFALGPGFVSPQALLERMVVVDASGDANCLHWFAGDSACKSQPVKWPFSASDLNRFLDALEASEAQRPEGELFTIGQYASFRPREVLVAVRGRVGGFELYLSDEAENWFRQRNLERLYETLRKLVTEIWD